MPRKLKNTCPACHNNYIQDWEDPDECPYCDGGCVEDVTVDDKDKDCSNCKHDDKRWDEIPCKGCMHDDKCNNWESGDVVLIVDE